MALDEKNSTDLNVMQWAKERFQIHHEAWRFAGVSGVLALVFFWIWWPIGWIFALVAIAILAFFRNPVRYVPTNPDWAIAAADGTIIAVDYELPPVELALPNVPHLRIATFLSVLDVHINRAPMSGTIVDSYYCAGQFYAANDSRAETQNERLALTLENELGERFSVVQIAGAIARRIVRWTPDGSHISVGQRYGLIRFGSRVDVWLPASFNARVAIGQRTLGGETVLAERVTSTDSSGSVGDNSPDQSADAPKVQRI